MKLKVFAASLMSLVCLQAQAATQPQTNSNQTTVNPTAMTQTQSSSTTTQSSNNANTASSASTASSSASSIDLSSEKNKLSYTIGVDMGQNFKQQNIDIYPEVLVQGLKDSLSGNKLMLSNTAMEQTLQSFQKQLHSKREADLKQVAQKNQQAGEIFFNDNKTKKGIVTLPSGLQYKIITAGKGPKPSENDTVTVDYTGRLLNGKVFDSTEKTGKPVSFRVSDVIPGWTEALQLMNEGSSWEVYIPASLAYGEQGIAGLIGPNETLIFTIHLISVKKPDNRTASTTTKSSNATTNTTAG